MLQMLVATTQPLLLKMRKYHCNDDGNEGSDKCIRYILDQRGDTLLYPLRRAWIEMEQPQDEASECANDAKAGGNAWQMPEILSLKRRVDDTLRRKKIGGRYCRPAADDTSLDLL